jgi:hypothetical protein
LEWKVEGVIGHANNNEWKYHRAQLWAEVEVEEEEEEEVEETLF